MGKAAFGAPNPKSQGAELLPTRPRARSRLDPDSQPAPAPFSPGKCSRTFISFSDDATFERCFPKCKPPRLPVRELCPVTHKPALYRDPITDIPYSNARAFRIIREAYRKYITAHGLPSADRKSVV